MNAYLMVVQLLAPFGGPIVGARCRHQLSAPDVGTRCGGSFHPMSAPAASTTSFLPLLASTNDFS